MLSLIEQWMNAFTYMYDGLTLQLMMVLYMYKRKNINKQVFVRGITSKQSFEKFFFHFMDYKMGVVYYRHVYK